MNLKVEGSQLLRSRVSAGTCTSILVERRLQFDVILDSVFPDIKTKRESLSGLEICVRTGQAFSFDRIEDGQMLSPERLTILS